MESDYIISLSIHVYLFYLSTDLSIYLSTDLSIHYKTLVWTTAARLEVCEVEYKIAGMLMSG